MVSCFSVTLVSTVVSRSVLTPLHHPSIVFSTWRLSLDLVEQALNQAFITTVRFDGKVAQKDRQPIINKFQNDPLIRVMLLTLSCGAVG